LDVQIQYRNLDNDIACPGEPFRLEVQSNMDLSTFTFMWSPADCILEDADTANPLVVADETKDFNVVISEAGMGFDTTLTITVTVDPPTVEIISSEGDSVFLSGSTTLSVIDPDAGSTYDWSTGESGVSIDITPEESGVYIVTVTDENGCTATDEYSLTVINPRCTEEDVFLPTAFSPNGDGNNDIYRVRSNFIKEMELTVFNRWGQQLFISTDPDIGWDGTYEGELLGPDAFAYCLKVTCVNDVEYVKAGSLSLLR